LIGEYTRLQGGTPEEATQSLNRLCSECFGHDLSECSADEGREIAIWLRQTRNRNEGLASSEAA